MDDTLERIVHLDFEPETSTREEITPAQECQVLTVYKILHFWKSRESCRKMATGEITLRCCMTSFPCCSLHRSLNVPWICPKCGKEREDEWGTWRPL